MCPHQIFGITKSWILPLISAEGVKLVFQEAHLYIQVPSTPDYISHIFNNLYEKPFLCPQVHVSGSLCILQKGILAYFVIYNMLKCRKGCSSPVNYVNVFV